MHVRSLFLDAMSALNQCLPDEAHKTNHGSNGFVNKNHLPIVSSNSKIRPIPPNMHRVSHGGKLHRACMAYGLWRPEFGHGWKLEDRSPRSVSLGSWRFVQSA